MGKKNQNNSNSSRGSGVYSLVKLSAYIVLLLSALLTLFQLVLKWFGVNFNVGIFATIREVCMILVICIASYGFTLGKGKDVENFVLGGCADFACGLHSVQSQGLLRSCNMRKFVEKIVIGVLSVALVLAVLGLVLSLRVLANAALVILMIAAVAFSVIQIAEYLENMQDKTKSKGLLAYMIASIIITLAIIVVSIFTFAGKLF